ncbi:E3 ubiquitin-protein ligase [Saccharomycopsis crataegensis]|uniref:Pre-mRNA-processing factor 19 n=1 Tax=Saccharomycopsis crataegensis TaxID=43959 RepID=A0AAV5QQ13_9ASCO|nr:E3 ubiquitin-protein ligase [Saccharomycopsis crataegensis]
MQCAISGELAKEPVLSPKSHMIFDKHIIESYILKYGKDPVTNDPLKLDEIIEVKPQSSDMAATKNFTSIPSLLSVFQNEWDAIVLENFELKKKIKTLKDDLASSVYHYDASIRVISRLTKERDEINRKLQSVLLAGNNHTSMIEPDTEVKETEAEVVKMDIDKVETISPEQKVKVDAEVESSVDQKPSSALPVEDPFKAIKEADKFLSAIHQRQLKEHKSSLNTSKHHLTLKNLFPFTEFENLSIPTSDPLLDHTASSIFNNEHMLVSNKTHLFVLNLRVNSLTHKFEISALHKGQLQCTAFINLGPISDPIFKPVVGFDDGTILVIDTDLSQNNAPESLSPTATIAIPSQESGASVVELLSHPSLNNYLIQIYSNGIWSIVDCNKGVTLFVSTLDRSGSFEYSCGDLHMDGSLLSIGTSNGLVLIYDMKSGQKLTTFQETLDEESAATKEDGGISGVSFASNGYWLVATSKSPQRLASKINIWDLRKGQITTSIGSNKIIRRVSLDKYSQILTILFTDDSVEFFKYLKKAKEWSQDSKLSESFGSFYSDTDDKNGLINIYWQKAFDRAFYMVKDDGKWGKFAIDFS